MRPGSNCKYVAIATNTSHTMSISCPTLVTSRVTSAASSIKIGGFTWPSAAPGAGSVLKTDGAGNLSFEPPNLRSTVDPASSAYTILPSDDIVAVTGTLDTTLTLPDPASKTTGDIIRIVKEVGGPSVVSVMPHGTELVSGGSSAVMSQPYESLNVYTNGADWFAFR